MYVNTTDVKVPTPSFYIFYNFVTVLSKNMLCTIQGYDTVNNSEIVSIFPPNGHKIVVITMAGSTDAQVGEVGCQAACAVG